MKMAIIEAIQSLRSAGRSCRAIARRLGLHRETVTRDVRLGREGDSKPAEAPISPAGSEEVAGFNSPTGNLPVAQASVSAPWLPWLLEQHARGLTAKQLPKRSGEYLFEIVLRRHQTRSKITTSNRPIKDCGKLLGDVPSASAILDRFLHHAEIISFQGKSSRLHDRSADGGAETGQRADRGSTVITRRRCRR